MRASQCVHGSTRQTRTSARRDWDKMGEFLETLREQRWDDHRYYHHSRINQSLHLVSAMSFLFAYVLIFKDPATAALVGWLVGDDQPAGRPLLLRAAGTTTRSTRRATSTRRRSRSATTCSRKVVLMSIWALSPLPLWFDPTLFGIFDAARRHGGVRPPHGADLAGDRRRRADLPHRAAVLRQGRAERARRGRRRSSPTRSTTSSSTTRRRSHLLRGELIDPHHGRHGWDEDEAEEAPHAS